MQLEISKPSIGDSLQLIGLRFKLLSLYQLSANRRLSLHEFYQSLLKHRPTYLSKWRPYKEITKFPRLHQNPTAFEVSALSAMCRT